jgi:hypothetical protein
MRFMMLMIPKVYQSDGGTKAAEGFVPDAESVEKMMKYNEALAKAGMLISLDGLHPDAMGARIARKGGKITVTDGPFTESKEVVGGYWMIQADSKKEAVEWAKRCPLQEGDTIEVRQVFEMTDFPADVREAADSPIIREQLEHQKHA